jgi:hypothetical protein
MMEELIEGVLEFFNQLRRCFPADSVDANSHRIIFTAIVAAYGTDSGEPSATMNTISVGDDPITKLEKKQASCWTTVDSPAPQQPVFTTPACSHELVV